jgi:hypothetical protein
MPQPQGEKAKPYCTAAAECNAEQMGQCLLRLSAFPSLKFPGFPNKTPDLGIRGNKLLFPLYVHNSVHEGLRWGLDAPCKPLPFFNNDGPNLKNAARNVLAAACTQKVSRSRTLFHSSRQSGSALLPGAIRTMLPEPVGRGLTVRWEHRVPRSVRVVLPPPAGARELSAIISPSSFAHFLEAPPHPPQPAFPEKKIQNWG